MREIQLSQLGDNKGKYVALVDDEDFEYLNQRRWSVHKCGKSFYAIRHIVVGGKKTMQYMHGAILNAKGIDHKDHNGLNNQRSNLRICTQHENTMNRRKRENSCSVYKGVCFYRATQKWVARITINGRPAHIGYFSCEIDAAMAYNAKAVELFGEYANLNKIN